MKERQEQILNDGENKTERFTSLQYLSNRYMSILCQIEESGEARDGD